MRPQSGASATSVVAATTAPSTASSTTSSAKQLAPQPFSPSTSPNERATDEIRNEIQRFESVHPCIYALYDLIDNVEELRLQEQLREQLVSVEDAFVNSQEWTLSRHVQVLRLGVIGSLNSGKSALVHYFLTGSGSTEESPEGGRFKKEISIAAGNSSSSYSYSHLLLIRDEGAQPPEPAFSQWLDGLLIVYAMESRETYQTALQYHKRVAAQRKDLNETLPVFLVATQDSSGVGSEEFGNPQKIHHRGGGGVPAKKRVVSEEEAQQAVQSLRMSGHLECCPAHGLNVDAIFQQACEKIVQQRRSLQSIGRITTPIGNTHSITTTNSRHGALCQTQSGSSLTAVNPYYTHREHYQRHQYPRAQDYFQQYPQKGQAGGSQSDQSRHPLVEASRQNNQQTSSASTFFQNDPYPYPHSSYGGQRQRQPRVAVSQDSHQHPSGAFTTFLMPAAPSSKGHTRPANGVDNRASYPEFMTYNGGDQPRPGTSPILCDGYGNRNGGGGQQPLSQAHLLQQYSRSTSSVQLPSISSSTSRGHRPADKQQHRGSLIDPYHSQPHHPYHSHNHPEQRDHFYEPRGGGHSTASAMAAEINGHDGSFIGSLASSSSTALVNHPRLHQSASHQPTPVGTPNAQRKTKRISNIFHRNNKEKQHGEWDRDRHNTTVAIYPHHNLTPPNAVPSPLQAYEERPSKKSSSVNVMQMGVGRAIPAKQGLLYKHSQKALTNNKEWKKKYVCLYPDGRLAYHTSLKDYMGRDSRAKELYLGLATVKVVGRKGPRGTTLGSDSRISSANIAARLNGTPGQQSTQANGREAGKTEDSGSEPTTPTATLKSGGEGNGGGTPGISDSDGTFGALISSTSSTGMLLPSQQHRGSMKGSLAAGGKAGTIVSQSLSKLAPIGYKGPSTPSVPLTSLADGSDVKKKRGVHRRGNAGASDGKKSEGGGGEGEEESEFEVITCDGKKWEFSAASAEERDDWVRAIEEQIGRCIQAQLSQKEQQQQQSQQQNGMLGSNHNNHPLSPSANYDLSSAKQEVAALRQLAGNDHCADCSASNPVWASLNLGTLICIECSGIHRNLGSHISKVRSLELDDWPLEYLAVMKAIGNATANRVWEHNAPLSATSVAGGAGVVDRPGPTSPRDLKERWIRLKYEQKRFLPPVPVDSTLGQQLVQAVLHRDIPALLVLLPRCNESTLNATVAPGDKRSLMHLACSNGAPELVQMLVWAGANPRAVDEHGRTALWYATQGGSAICTHILTSLGVTNEWDASCSIAGKDAGRRNGERLQNSIMNTQHNDMANGAAVALMSDSLPTSAI